MAQGLFGKDTCQVVFIAELIEHGNRRAPHGVLEIDRIAQVDGQGQRVDDDEHPFTDRLIYGVLLPAHWQHDQHDPECVSIEYGGCVEYKTSTQQFKEMGCGQTVGIEIVVL